MQQNVIVTSFLVSKLKISLNFIVFFNPDTVIQLNLIMKTLGVGTMKITFLYVIRVKYKEYKELSPYALFITKFVLYQ